MPMLDIFNSDAFGVVSLTDAVNKVKFVPGRIGQMGLFMETGVSTTSVAVEEKNGVLALVATSPRGAPGVTLDKSLRSVRDFRVPHYEIDDAVMAEEVQNVRAFGSESVAETVMAKVAERSAIHTASMEATHEYSRIGAIKGVVTYPTGSSPATLNLFTEFGVAQETAVDFDLDDATPESGEVRAKCAGVVRQVAGILEGTPFTGLHAFCGDTFFDALIAHPEVRDTYLATQAAAELRQGYVQGGLSYGAFPFGGIMWENYRGSVNGTDYITTGDAQIFPVGVPGLFRTYYAPADYEETVNTIGQRLYMKQWPMPNGKGRNFDVQMNALDICTRPRVLIRATHT
jgi:hypothetical protein